MKTKGTMTVKRACEIAFRQMRKVYSVIVFCESVRMLTGRPYLMDGTILRRLRELRGESVCLYRVIDPDKGKYLKVRS
jgi:hypothetical protein